jgi:hypothetical protein
MVEETDIWRTANRLLAEYGEKAPVIAAQRAQALLARGDMDHHRMWRRVFRAIEELRRVDRRRGEKVN